MRFGGDAAQRVRGEAEALREAGKAREAEEAERLCLRVAPRCEDRRDQHRIGACCRRATDRNFGMTGGGERETPRRAQARDHVRTASRASRLAFGEVEPHDACSRGELGCACNEKQDAAAAGERCQAAQPIPFRFALIGAPDQRRAARQAAKCCLRVRRPLGIRHRDQRHRGPPGGKGAGGAQHPRAVLLVSSRA